MPSRHLTVAFRFLRRRLGYSLLNVIGLGAGLACCILIGLWVQDELSYDNFHPYADQTYRVINSFHLPEVQASISGTPSALAPTIREDLPAARYVVQMAEADGVVRQGDREYVETDLLYVNADFLEVFGFDLLRGSASLDEPGTALITPSMEQKYFADESAIGKRILHDGMPLTVTGIVEASPSNTHLAYSLLGSIESREFGPEGWGYNYFTTYVTLRADADADAAEANLASVIGSTLGEEFQNAGVDGKPQQTFSFQPVTGVHLGQGAPPDIDAAGSYTYVLLFSGLAVFVLLLACINFMNLATARSAERANEVGVRRAMGARGGELATQFLSESFLLTASGLGVAIFLCTLALPWFNDLAGKSLGYALLFSPRSLLAYAGLLVVVGLVAGSYPAFVLSRFRPVETLRGKSSSSSGQPRLRQALVVVSFAISIALIACTLIVKNQVDYMQTKGLGFDETNVLVIDQLHSLSGPLQSRDDVPVLQNDIRTFKEELRQIPSVQTVSSGYSLPGTRFINSLWKLDRPDAKRHNFDYTYVGDDYVETLGLTMVAGRDFSPSIATDSSAAVINESAAQTFGYAPQQILGESIPFDEGSLKIIGVVKDFHIASLHREISPMLLFHEDMRPPQYAALRVDEAQTARAIEDARAVWGSFTDLSFNYSFLANDLTAQYRTEQRIGELFTVLAGLAILIACLGLLGLAAYTTQQRTKEIGIRKALGATLSQMLLLLSKDFLALVLIAFAIAGPVAYVGMERWIAQFAYRINIDPTTLLLAGLSVLIVAVVSVSTQAYRAARADPATALQME